VLARSPTLAGSRRRDAGERELVGSQAANRAAVAIGQERNLLCLAALNDVPAPWVKCASGREVGWIRNVTLQNDSVRFPVGVRFRHRGE
jgi:hypothetical protein